MISSRREFMLGFGTSLIGTAGWNVAYAQDYPSRDITLVCGFPPGSSPDLLVRFYADKLRIISGRNILVENKIGASGNIATEYVARSKPDGHTLYPFAVTAVALAQNRYKSNSIDTRSVQVAASIMMGGYALMVDKNSPYKTVADLTAAMKKKGLTASFATSAEAGTIVGALFKSLTGVQAVEVPYRTPLDSLNELQTGHLDYAIHDVGFGMQQREKRVRILAVSMSERLAMASDVPTLVEAGVPLELNTWWGVMLPTGTPRPIVDKINDWFKEIGAREETRNFLLMTGAVPMARSPDEAEEMFRKALVEWGEYARIADLPKQ